MQGSGHIGMKRHLIYNFFFLSLFLQGHNQKHLRRLVAPITHQSYPSHLDHIAQAARFSSNNISGVIMRIHISSSSPFNRGDGVVAANVFTVGPTAARRQGGKRGSWLSARNNWKMILIA